MRAAFFVGFAVRPRRRFNRPGVGTAHLLETFSVRGEDGKQYVVRGYEHLAHLEGAPDLPDQWHATGLAEYRLASGERVDVDRAGAMTVANSGMRLQRDNAARASGRSVDPPPSA